MLLSWIAWLSYYHRQNRYSSTERIIMRMAMMMHVVMTTVMVNIMMLRMSTMMWTYMPSSEALILILTHDEHTLPEHVPHGDDLFMNVSEM